MISAAEIAAALDEAGELFLVDVQRLDSGPGRVRRVPSAADLAPAPLDRLLASTWAEAFGLRTVAVDGGHLHWSGALSEHGTPVLHLRDETQTAYRYAFRTEYGREAEGRVVPVCGYARCVAGSHLEDSRMRAELRAHIEAEPAPVGATWHRGMDLVAIERVLAGSPPLPVLTEDEAAYAVVVGTARGLSAEELGERLRVAARTVVRMRADLGLSDDGA